jgi:DNA ligase (NAD+)
MDPEFDYQSHIQNAQNLSTKELEDLISFLAYAYYNEEELTDDTVYDYLIDLLKLKDPKSKILTQVGAPLSDRSEKIKLPFFAPSMNKVKPDTRDLELYLEKFKGPYILSDKIDGDSAILHYKAPNFLQIYTRGKGIYGHDISFLREYLNIPSNKDLKKYGELKIRGEIMVSKKIFASKYADLRKPRTVVTSMITSQRGGPGIVFLAFELMERLTQKEKFEKLQQMGFQTPYYTVEEKLTSSKLTSYLEKRNRDGEYDIDGIIISNNQVYSEPKSTTNPKHSVAFKINARGIKTKVIDLEWNETKHGILFPRIQIDPIVIEGDIIRFVSGKNAKDILVRKIGIGAQVLVVKSGGVIPEITSVVKGVKETQFPDVDFVWDENKVNIVLTNTDNNQNVQIKRLLHFFTSLDIERFKEGNVAKFYKSRFKTITSICTAAESDFLKVDAIGERMAKIIFTEIHKVIDHPIELNKLMFASFIFDKGLGSKRLQMAISAYPSKIYKMECPTMEEMLKVEGFSKITSKQFIEGFPLFEEFMKKHPFLKIEKQKSKKVKSKEGDLTGKFVVFSGFRDKNLEKEYINRGATIQNSVNKKTNLVVADDLESSSSKVKKAKELGIIIIKK